MDLPRLPVRGEPARRETMTFLGLNRTENVREGELSSTWNMSTDNFPALSPRLPRAEITGFTAPTDIFAWDGKLLVIDGTNVVYDGETVGTVTAGRKQFAVVNTKLCIWPDKAIYDLTNGSFTVLGGEISTGTKQGSVTMTDNSISAVPHPMRNANESVASLAGDATAINFTTYAYGNVLSDGTAHDTICGCWTGTAWDADALAALQTKVGLFSTLGGAVDIAPGDVFIPRLSSGDYRMVTGLYQTGQAETLPDTSTYNTEGIYGVYRTYTGEISADTHITIIADLYRVGDANPLFSTVLKVGDTVNVTGTRWGVGDAEHRQIVAIDELTNTVTFTDGSFSISYCVSVSAGISAGAEFAFKYTPSGGTEIKRSFTPTVDIPAGMALIVETEDMDSVVVWDPALQHEIARFPAAAYTGTAVNAFYAYDPVSSVPIKLARDVPDMDFICESGNRLWGVSNSQENKVWNEDTQSWDRFTSRIIRASALGEPEQFWQFAGLSTDSWQLAVGSEGDFTGICAFGGAVCCWKEQMLYKIMGTYPEEYYTAEYHIPGPAVGSERSLTLCGDCMMYAGRDDVYVWSGGTPTSVGTALGGPVHNGVGGWDGAKYYLSAAYYRGNTAHVLVYDMKRGLWIQEDNEEAAAFVRCAGTFYLLGTPGLAQPAELYALNQLTADEQSTLEDAVDWSAVFVPFFEQDSSGTRTRRRWYTRLELRLDMEAGSTIEVSVKLDKAQQWTKIGEITAATPLYKVFYIPLKRCDRMELLLNGTGKVLVRDLTRVFLMGSER